MTEISQRRNLFIYLCLAAAIVVVYLPVRHFGFVNFDDDLYVTQNPHLRGGLTLRGLAWAATTPLDQWMPVTWLTRMLEYHLFGLNAGAYHLVNVLFHIANTLLLFGILNRMTGAPWRSACVAALFALHPLHVESVAWVTGLKDVLSTCFAMLTIWTYGRYVDEFTVHGSRVKIFYGLTILLFVLALMSKPMVVTLPFVLLLLDYWPLGRTRWANPSLTRSGPTTGESVKVSPSQLVKEKIPLFALTAGACAMTYWAQRGLGTVLSLERLPPGMRIANALLAYVDYVGKTFWPAGLASFYPWHLKLPVTTVVCAALGLVAVTVAVIERAQRAPWLATGWFWYLGTLVPVAGLVQVGGQSMADRYTYFPLVGLFMILCWSIPHGAIKERIWKAVIGFGTGAVLAACAVLSRVQAAYWKDSQTLFYHALDVTRDNWLAYYNLGVALWRAGRVQEAIVQYEQVLRIEPDYAEAHNNLGVALEQMGRLEEAIRHYERVVQLKPGYANAHNNLGNALRKMGKVAGAIEHYEEALRFDPNLAETHYNLGILLVGASRVQEAIEHFQEALRFMPGMVDAHYNLGVALERTGNSGGAIEHYKQALRLKPDLTQAQIALARLRGSQ